MNSNNDQKYHLFNSAVTFDLAYDPYINWHSDSIGTYYNPNLLEDSVANPNAPLEDGEKTLDELTESMRVVEPGDYDTYLTLWRAYQLRWNKLTPNILNLRVLVLPHFGIGPIQFMICILKKQSKNN